MQQIDIINLLLKATARPAISSNTTKLDPDQVTGLYKKCSLPYNFFFTGEYRIPKRGEFYLEFFEDAKENGALRYYIHEATATQTVKYMIGKSIAVTARCDNKFDLKRCIKVDGGGAFFRGKPVTLVSEQVDSNLRIPVLNKSKVYEVVSILDLVNEDAQQRSIEMFRADAEFQTYSKWKPV